MFAPILADGEILPMIQAGFIIAGILALIYGFVLGQHSPNNLRTIVKTLSIGSLAVLSWQMGGPSGLTIALALSALGDFFLAHDGEKYFLPGLGAFLAAHIAYCILFWSIGGGITVIFQSNIALAMAGFFVLTAILALAQLFSHLGPLKTPVVVYVLAITAMGLMALTLPGQFWVVIGAILFMISDFILAQEQFMLAQDSPLRRITSPLLWSCYWIGQALIAASILTIATG